MLAALIALLIEAVIAAAIAAAEFAVAVIIVAALYDLLRLAMANRPPGEGEDATAEGAGAEDAGEDATCGPKRRKGGGRRRAPTGLEDKRRILDWLLEQAETPGNIQTINKLRGEIAVLLERLRR